MRNNLLCHYSTGYDQFSPSEYGFQCLEQYLSYGFKELMYWLLYPVYDVQDDHLNSCPIRNLDGPTHQPHQCSSPEHQLPRCENDCCRNTPESSNDLIAMMNKPYEKARFIAFLQNVQIDHADYGRWKNMVHGSYPHVILSSTDGLNGRESSKIIQLVQVLMEARQRFPELRIVYIDHSSAPFSLQKIAITLTTRPGYSFPGSTNPTETKDSEKCIVPAPMQPGNSSIPKSKDRNAMSQCTNVLLVGESGVGKSTFINAIANYLRFSSLDEAMKKPTVVIPVSFLITTGSNFDEKVLYFGECRNRDNENFNDEGQSVTQECQEYEFDVPFQGGTKRIRIIDTPGFADTRGIKQDEKNLDHIKQYILRYESLDAICFLLKPNESRLHVSFNVCFSKLAGLLGENMHKKLLFCFTNTRSTFYAPGNTGPLLRKMLSSLQNPSVTLEKENTFCFDNESFRYLVAKRHGIQFSVDEERDYNKSWNISVNEAKRFLNRFVSIS